jgi:hypothetical protein
MSAWSVLNGGRYFRKYTGSLNEAATPAIAIEHLIFETVSRDRSVELAEAAGSRAQRKRDTGLIDRLNIECRAATRELVAFPNGVLIPGAIRGSVCAATWLMWPTQAKMQQELR